MLTDTKLKNLKPQDKLYKVSDRDGLYVAVLTSGTVSFRYDYRINGRRETLVIGQYGRDGISLAEAREELIAAKKLLKAGQSPAVAKRDGIKKIRGAETFAVHTDSYMKHVILAESTRAMKREIISSVYRHANDRGHGLFNPAADIKPSSIAIFKPRERTLTPEEIGLFFRTLDAIGAMGTMKMALKLVLITMVRKGEFTNATWDEIDFKKWTWTIPSDRMKGSRVHVIYLPKQAQDILVGLQMCAGGSEYLVPGRYNFRKPLSNAALNSLIDRTVKIINEDGEHIQDFTVHDMRRTASTLLHEAGYPSDWIEKALAHEQKGVRAVYNKAEYARQRAYMLQQWADMIDAWINGEHTDLVPFSPSKFERWMEDSNK